MRPLPPCTSSAVSKSGRRSIDARVASSYPIALSRRNAFRAVTNAIGGPRHFPSSLVRLIHFNHLNRYPADDPHDGQQWSERLHLVPTMVGDLDVARTNRALAQGGIKGDPLTRDPDFRPHVKTH